MADERSGDVVIEDLSAQQSVGKFNKKAKDAGQDVPYGMEWRDIEILSIQSDKNMAIVEHEKAIAELDEAIGKNREKITEITNERVVPEAVTLS